MLLISFRNVCTAVYLIPFYLRLCVSNGEKRALCGAAIWSGRDLRFSVTPGMYATKREIEEEMHECS
jgi:hypothetical protein